MRGKVGVLLGLALSACASNKLAIEDDSMIGNGIDVETMRPPEAAQVVREFQEVYGFPPVAPPATPVTSMAQVLEIVQQDRLPEFEKARRFAAEHQGAEALTLRAYLELSYAGALTTASWILEQERRQDLAERRRLSQARPLEDPASEADQKRIARLNAKSADLRKTIRALQVLAEEALGAGSDLAEEAIRQDPEAQLAYLAKATYYRLRGEWLEFDRMMRYAGDGPDDSAIKTFLRGMEAYQRFVDRQRSHGLLKDALEKNPQLVRAQANLVLVDIGTEAKYEELQQLKAISPNHLVVRLVGRMIEQEYKTASELDHAGAQ